MISDNRLRALLDAFSAARPQYACPRQSFEMCDIASILFKSMVEAHDVKAALVYLEARITPFPDPYKGWLNVPIENVCHFVIRLPDGLYYDWTSRQFDAKAEWPGVRTREQLISEWGVICEEYRHSDAAIPLKIKAEHERELEPGHRIRA